MQPAPRSPCSIRPCSRGRWVCRLWPLLLWAFGTFYFGGQLGRWEDDWNCTKRDPVTGASTMHPYWFYPRPLGTNFAVIKDTWLWKHDRLNHFIGALFHGMTVLLLWRFLRIFTKTRQAAILAALAFLVFPLHYEIIFWPAASHAGVAVSLFLALAMLYVHYARGASAWWCVPVMLVLAYTIPCVWEQPAAGIPALIFLYWIRRGRWRHWAVEAARAAVPLAGCLFLCWVYVQQVIAETPPDERGGADTLVNWSELPHRFAELWPPIQVQLFGRGMQTFVAGSIVHGFRALAGLWGILCLMLVTGTGFLWVKFCWTRREVLWERGDPVSFESQGDRADVGEQAQANASVARSRGSDRTTTRGWVDDLLLTAFGLALFVLAWEPIAEIRAHGVATRLFYFPLVGLTLVGAVWLDRILIVWQRELCGTSWLAAATGAIVVVAMILGVVGQVGTQDAFRTRYAMDLQLISQLRSLVPNPPQGTVFVPLRLASLPAHTGYANFDDFANSALATAWSSPIILREAYRRRDLLGTFVINGEALPLRGFDSNKVRYYTDQHVELEGSPQAGFVLPYERMLPFTVDWDNHVQLVDRVDVENPDLTLKTLMFPRVAEWAKATKLGPRTIVVQDGQPDAALRPLGTWRWVGSGKPVGFRKHVDWGQENEAVSLMVGERDRNREALSIRLSPTPDTTALLFRVTLGEADLRYIESGQARIHWRLSGAEPRVLAEQVLNIADLRREQKWLPVRVIVPPHANEQELQMTVTSLVPASPNRVRAKVTPGFVSSPSKQ